MKSKITKRNKTHHAIDFTQTEQCLIIRSCKINASAFFNTNNKRNKISLN